MIWHQNKIFTDPLLSCGMRMFLEFVVSLSEPIIILLFLAENVLITLLSLLCGNAVIRLTGNDVQSVSRKEWFICGITNCINTAITYLGFKLWQYGIIEITFDFSWTLVLHLLILFLAMDFLMFVFHYLIHHTFLYKHIHLLHHEAVNPKPVDLFVLHPLETFAFGFLWLGVLCVSAFNIYAISAYLIINVLLGVVGHLGIYAKNVS